MRTIYFLSSLIVGVFLGLMIMGAAKPMDPDKPLFQTNALCPDFAAKLHPGLDEVTPLSADEIRKRDREDQKRRRLDKLFNWGMIMFAIGCPVLIFGFTATGTLKQYGFQMFGHLFFFVGLSVGGTGVYMMIMAQHWIWTALLFSVSGILVVVYMIFATKLKDRGIELKLRRRKV